MNDSRIINEGVTAHQLISMLRQTNEVLLKIRQKELVRYDLTPEQASALMAIHTLGDKATTAETARRLFRESNSMVVLLRRLEKRGLISKIADTNRKNVFKICLTDKGLAAYQSAMEMKAFNRIIKKMNDKKRRQLLLLLEKLRDYALRDMKLDVKYFSDFARMVSDRR